MGNAGTMGAGYIYRRRNCTINNNFQERFFSAVEAAGVSTADAAEQQQFEKRLIEEQRKREEGTVRVKCRKDYERRNNPPLLMRILVDLTKEGNQSVTIDKVLVQWQSKTILASVSIISGGFRESSYPITLDKHGASASLSISIQGIVNGLGAKPDAFNIIAKDTLDNEYVSEVIDCRDDTFG